MQSMPSSNRLEQNWRIYWFVQVRSPGIYLGAQLNWKAPTLSSGMFLSPSVCSVLFCVDFTLSSISPSFSVTSLAAPAESKYSIPRGFPRGAGGKEPNCQCRRYKRCEFEPWVREISWRRESLPTPVFLPENPMDRGACWATVHGVAKSRTRLRQQHAQTLHCVPNNCHKSPVVETHWTESGHTHLLNPSWLEGWKVWVGDVLFRGDWRVSLTGTSWISKREGSFPKGKPSPLPEEGGWRLLRQNKHGNSRCPTQVMCDCHGLIWIVKPEIKVFVYSLLLRLILWLICFSWKNWKCENENILEFQSVCLNFILKSYPTVSFLK